MTFEGNEERALQEYHNSQPLDVADNQLLATETQPAAENAAYPYTLIRTTGGALVKLFFGVGEEVEKLNAPINKAFGK